MKRLTLTYRDGNNYKCEWDVEVSDEVFTALPPPDNEGFTDINALHLKYDDIPMIKQYGYREESDHPYVKIVAIDGPNTATLPILVPAE